MFEKVSQINLVNANIPDLSIIYRDENLTSQRKNIYAIRVKLVNSGSVSVSSDDVSSLDPLGFGIKTGKFVRVSLAVASTSHLSNYSKPVLASEKRVSISRGVIFDPGDFIVVDTLVTENSPNIPILIPYGKIKNQDNIRFKSSSENDLFSNLISEAFSGGFVVQAIRTLSYAILFLGFVIGGIFILSRIQSFKMRNFYSVVERINDLPEIKGSSLFKHDIITIANLRLSIGAELFRELCNYIKMLETNNIDVMSNEIVAENGRYVFIHDHFDVEDMISRGPRAVLSYAASRDLAHLSSEKISPVFQILMLAVQNFVSDNIYSDGVSKPTEAQISNFRSAIEASVKILPKWPAE